MTDTNAQTADNTPDNGLADAGAIDNDAYGNHQDDNSDDNQDGAQNTGDDNQDDEEEFHFDGVVLGSPPSEDEGDPQDSELVKALRKRLKEQSKELREKRITSPAPAASAAAQPLAPMPEKPKLEDDGIDYDPDVFQQRLDAWYTQKAQHDAQTAQHEGQQKALVERYNTRKDEYKTRVAALKVRGYEDAEAFVAGELSAEVQGALMLHADRPEHVVLALARNPELMKQMKGVTDPVTLGVLIGTIQAKAKALPKGKQSVRGAPPEPRGTASGQLQSLEAEIEKARSSGDYTRVVQLKRKKAAAK